MLADRLIGVGARQAKVMASIEIQQSQIGELRKMVCDHETTLNDIKQKCAYRVAQTSTTEEMRKIVKEEVAEIPDMIIAKLYNKGVLPSG